MRRKDAIRVSTSMPSLFSLKNPVCPLYRALRDAEDPTTNECRYFAEKLWGQFQPFADTNFLDEAGRDFQTRFWEMYLTCTLLENASRSGYAVTCPKPGPDCLLTHNGARIWIEAVAATNGDESKPDSVIPVPAGHVYKVPDEQIILRYTTAIQEKFRKYVGYLADGTIQFFEPYVIAINGGKLHYQSDADMPRFLKALFPIGHQQVLIDKHSKKVVDVRNQYRPQVLKLNGSPVSTQIFVDPAFAGLSAVLHSYAKPWGADSSLGADFFLAHNPLATNRVSRGTVPCVREYWASSTVEGDGALHYDEHDLTA